LLAASREAFALRRGTETRELLARSRQAGAEDEVLAVEQRVQEATLLLWSDMLLSEQRMPEARAVAREVVTAAKRLAAETHEPRVRRAYLDALVLDYDIAMQDGDLEALLRAAEAREAASRGLAFESQLAASVEVGVALHLHGRTREACDRFRRIWVDAQRHVLPRLAVDA